VLDLIQQMQKTAYSNYDEQLVDEYVKIQDTCNTGALPTDVQPPATNMTAIPGIDYSTPSNASCLSGKSYSAKPGDDMQTIAKAQGSESPHWPTENAEWGLPGRLEPACRTELVG
jgi:hypothetical protein